MNAGPVCAAILLIGLMPIGSLRAQQGITLQLPTFRSFSVATTVVVPDRGGAYLGGGSTARSAERRSGRGASAIGLDRGANRVHVTAHVHDLRGMDQALQHPGNYTENRNLSVRRSDAHSPIPSVREIERQREVAQAAVLAEAADWFRRGCAAHTAGKTGLAKTYWQMALRRASGELHQQVVAALARLDTAEEERLAVED